MECPANRGMLSHLEARLLGHSESQAGWSMCSADWNNCSSMRIVGNRITELQFALDVSSIAIPLAVIVVWIAYLPAAGVCIAITILVIVRSFFCGLEISEDSVRVVGLFRQHVLSREEAARYRWETALPFYGKRLVLLPCGHAVRPLSYRWRADTQRIDRWLRAKGLSEARADQ